ncbi:MAG: ankyrin repeat domain-containing protein [Anaerolineales bacterium]
MSSNELDLIRAAREGDISTVKRLLNLGTTVDAKDEKGWTALLYAAYEGREDVVAELIEKGASTNEKTPEKFTPLMEAAYNGSLRIVKMLLEHGAAVNEKDVYGWTPLMFVTIDTYTKTHHVDLATLLLNKGADAAALNKAGWNAAMMARKNGMLELERLLLQHIQLQAPPVDPLHKYIESIGSSLPQDAGKEIEAILDAGQDINQKDRGTGATALDIAARNNNAGAIRLLLDRGADPDIPNLIGRTPLVNAAVWGKTNSLKALLGYGANVNSIELWGGTALDAARDDNNYENVKLLIEAGADVNARDVDGNTPLMKAVLNKQADIEKLLLQNGADPNVKNNYGHTLEDMRRMSMLNQLL